MYRYPVFFPSVKEREKNARKFEEQEKQKESIIKEEVKKKYLGCQETPPKGFGKVFCQQ